MKLNNTEKKHLLNLFPNIELSYEKKIYNKVQKLNTNHIYLTIPKGGKYFAWFFKYKNNKLCILLNINRRNKNKITSINVCQCNFDNILANGTIFYGTIFNIRNFKFFNIEDIFYYKGYNVSSYNDEKKFKLLYIIMNNYIKQTYYTNNSIIFGLPNISDDYNDIKNILSKLPYDVYCIQHRNIKKKYIFLNEIIKLETINNNRNVTFLIKPTLETDIYILYYYNKNKLEKYDIAHIPDYKTSVLMNSIFRKIKENYDLDKLEESDDEEEFENISEYKYVFLDKQEKFNCIYNNRFKRWIPIGLSNKRIVNNKEIFNFKK
jgi:hypothetical protein